MSLFLSINPQPLVQVGGTGGQGNNLALTTTSANLALKAGNTYRVISNADAYFRLSKQAAGTPTPATNADIFLPKGLPMVLIANGWDQISAIAVTGTGTLGAVQIQPPV